MSKVDLTPDKLAEWKKELRRSIDEQVPLPRCLNTKNMLAMVEEIAVLNKALEMATNSDFMGGGPCQQNPEFWVSHARKQLTESEATNGNNI